jgi:hypothetical protein
MRRRGKGQNIREGDQQSDGGEITAKKRINHEVTKDTKFRAKTDAGISEVWDALAALTPTICHRESGWKKLDFYGLCGVEAGACKSILNFVLPRVAHEDLLHPSGPSSLN